MGIFIRVVYKPTQLKNNYARYCIMDIFLYLIDDEQALFYDLIEVELVDSDDDSNNYISNYDYDSTYVIDDTDYFGLFLFLLMMR